MSVYTLVRIMKIAICKSKRKMTYHSNNWLINYTHSFKTMYHAIFQNFICWHNSILCFLQVLYPIKNHIFNIKYVFVLLIIDGANLNKIDRFLQIPQLNSDMPAYTHNPYSTQFKSIHLMVLIFMLVPVLRHSIMIFLKQFKIYKNEI